MHHAACMPAQPLQMCLLRGAAQYKSIEGSQLLLLLGRSWIADAQARYRGMQITAIQGH